MLHAEYLEERKYAVKKGGSMGRRVVFFFAVFLLVSLTGYSGAAESSAPERTAAISFPNYYPSLLFGSAAVDATTSFNAVVSINFDPNFFTLSEAEEQFALLTSLLSLLGDFGTFGWLSPTDLSGYDADSVVQTVQEIYLSYGYDIYVVLDVWKAKWNHLPEENERIDIYIDDSVSLMYIASIEFPLSFLGGGLIPF